VDGVLLQQQQREHVRDMHAAWRLGHLLTYLVIVCHNQLTFTDIACKTYQ
jgi:hypothetical protein